MQKEQSSELHQAGQFQQHVFDNRDSSDE